MGDRNYKQLVGHKLHLLHHQRAHVRVVTALRKHPCWGWRLQVQLSGLSGELPQDTPRLVPSSSPKPAHGLAVVRGCICDTRVQCGAALEKFGQLSWHLCEGFLCLQEPWKPSPALSVHHQGMVV